MVKCARSGRAPEGARRNFPAARSSDKKSSKTAIKLAQFVKILEFSCEKSLKGSSILVYESFSANAARIMAL